MTILSLSNRTIEGFVKIPSILGSDSKIEVRKDNNIQGTLDSIEELMDLKGKLYCHLKIVHQQTPTRYAFIKGEMSSNEFRDKVTEVCKELC